LKPNPFRSLSSLIALSFLALIAPCQSLADDDPSRGMLRSLNIDNPAVQNTYYLSASVNNDMSAGHYYYLYGEGLFALGKDWGLEADLPEIIGRQPLGQGPAAFESVGLDLRYVAYQFGTSDSDEAGVFSIQAGGDYAFPDARFKFLSGSLTPELLGGYRSGKWFIQGNYGFNEMVDRESGNNLFANTGLGYSLSGDWFLQVEANYTDFLNDPKLGTQWIFVPQVAFVTGDWLFELGEELNESNAGTTDLLIAHTL